MVKSDWGVVLTLVGCLGLAALGLADVKSQPKPPIYCDKGANGANCRPQQYVTERSGIPGFFEGSISNPEPKTGVDHEKRDLAAQEASAVFSFWMVIIAACSAVVTSIGTILLFMQITLTRKAVEDTGKATEAMREANALAQNAKRPWLKLEVAQDAELIGTWTGDTPFFHSIQIAAKITNFGESPAMFPVLEATLFTWDQGVKREVVESMLRKNAKETGIGREPIFRGETRRMGENTMYYRPPLCASTGNQDEKVDSRLGVIVGVFYRGIDSTDWHYTKCVLNITIADAILDDDRRPVTLKSIFVMENAT